MLAFKSIRTGGFSALVAALGLMLGGCVVEEHGKVPVRGRVTLNGGDWPQSGVLYFTPAGLPPDSDEARAAVTSAAFDRSGSFVVNRSLPGEGLLPGDYLVGVECLDYPANQLDPGGRAPLATSLIPDRFRRANTSGLKVTVKRGEGGGDLVIDVKTK
ncbi:MAG: hypothetical protein U0835_10205 [Isosphaeraceae bacterium]